MRRVLALKANEELVLAMPDNEAVSLVIKYPGGLVMQLQCAVDGTLCVTEGPVGVGVYKPWRKKALPAQKGKP